MLLNKVALGKPWFTDKAEGIRAPPEGYDSVRGIRIWRGFRYSVFYAKGCCKPGDPSGDDKMVVYNANAIRPQYLIIYVEF